MHGKGENYLKAALWLAAQKHGSKVDIPAAQGGFWGVQQRDVWGSLWESWRSWGGMRSPKPPFLTQKKPTSFA